MRRALRLLGFAALCGALGLWSAFQLVLLTANYAMPGAVWRRDEAAITGNPRYAGGAVLAHMRDQTPKDARALVFRQADYAAYAGRDWYMDLDRALIPFYQLDDSKAAWAWLRAHGVTHIMLPPYMPGTFTNSQAWAVAGDPALARPVASHRGFRLYALEAAPQAVACQPLPVTEAPLWLWRERRGWLAGLADALGLPAIFSGRDYLLADRLPAMARPGAATALDWAEGESVRLVTGAGTGFEPPLGRALSLPPGSGRLVVRGRLSGDGLAAISLFETGPDHVALSPGIWDSAQVGGAARSFAFQLRPRPDSTGFRLLFENLSRPAGRLNIEALEACVIGAPPAAPSPPLAPPASGPAWPGEGWSLCRNQGIGDPACGPSGGQTARIDEGGLWVLPPGAPRPGARARLDMAIERQMRFWRLAGMTEGRLFDRINALAKALLDKPPRTRALRLAWSASGDGIADLLVLWRDAGGRTRTELADRVVLDDQPRAHATEIWLPEGAADPAPAFMLEPHPGAGGRLDSARAAILPAPPP